VLSVWLLSVGRPTKNKSSESCLRVLGPSFLLPSRLQPSRLQPSRLQPSRLEPVAVSDFLYPSSDQGQEPSSLLRLYTRVMLAVGSALIILVALPKSQLEI
jgi:hypothetical protein